MPFAIQPVKGQRPVNRFFSGDKYIVNQRAQPFNASGRGGFRNQQNNRRDFFLEDARIRADGGGAADDNAQRPAGQPESLAEADEARAARPERGVVVLDGARRAEYGVGARAQSMQVVLVATAAELVDEPPGGGDFGVGADCEVGGDERAAKAASGAGVGLVIHIN